MCLTQHKKLQWKVQTVRTPTWPLLIQPSSSLMKVMISFKPSKTLETQSYTSKKSVFKIINSTYTNCMEKHKRWALIWEILKNMDLIQEEHAVACALHSYLIVTKIISSRLGYSLIDYSLKWASNSNSPLAIHTLSKMYQEFNMFGNYSLLITF